MRDEAEQLAGKLLSISGKRIRKSPPRRLLLFPDFWNNGDGVKLLPD
jgi:hypothetical protein